MVGDRPELTDGAEGKGASPSPSPTALSAIVATVGRIAPLARLLDSLATQTALPAEVIIVDQNVDPLPDTVLRPAERPFALRHLHHPSERNRAGAQGVSWARNLGWREARAAWLLFPDDDCWYPPHYVEQALRIARESGARVVTGRPTDETGRTINGRFEQMAGPVSRRNVFIIQIEWNMLVERRAMEALGGYDETISLGGATPWQGGEGYDLILRALARGMPCRYDPGLIAHHEELPVSRPDSRMVAKGRDYALGLGRVLAVHGYGPGSIFYWSARSGANLVASALCLRRDRMRYFSHQLVGRLEGYRGSTLPFPRHAEPADRNRAPADAEARETRQTTA